MVPGCPAPAELPPSPVSMGRDTEGIDMMPFIPLMLTERTGGLGPPLDGPDIVIINYPQYVDKAMVSICVVAL